MKYPEDFVDINIDDGKHRVTWEYIGEGWSGDYDPNDSEDIPLLRFSCDVCDEDFNPQCESVGASPWIGMDDASYCTRLPTSTPKRALLQAAGIILEAIDTDGSYRKALEALSWFCLQDFGLDMGEDLHLKQKEAIAAIIFEDNDEGEDYVRPGEDTCHRLADLILKYLDNGRVRS